MHYIRTKVVDLVPSPAPISAEKYSAKDSFRIEIGCAFFVTFFAQAKKVNECAHETRVSPVSATASKIGCGFFVPFFAQAKKGSRWTGKKKESSRNDQAFPNLLLQLSNNQKDLSCDE